MAAADAVFAERDRRQVAWWGLSLVVVLAVHGGITLLLLSRQIVSTPVPAPPAVLIELAPLPAAPPAPQQPAQEAVAPAMTEPLPPARPEPLPPPEPPTKPEAEAAQPPPEESAAPPAVTMPAAKPEPRPKHKPKAQRPSQPQPIDRPPPPRIAAPARPAPVQPVPVPALPAPTSAATPAAPSVSPAALAAARTNWQGQLLAWLSRHKRYPREAEERRQQGTAHLRFVVDRYGRVLSYSLVRSSGFAALDEEIMALIQRAQPLPPPPAELPGMRFDLIVPVSFSLHRN
ncbi:MAG: energy transducer TonB [Alphaproteobacteria bacterium]